MIPLPNAVNGSTTSFNLEGLNISHLCDSTTVRNFSSVFIRNASASFNNESASVLAAGSMPTSGDTSPSALRGLAGETSRLSKRWSWWDGRRTPAPAPAEVGAFVLRFLGRGVAGRSGMGWASPRVLSSPGSLAAGLDAEGAIEAFA